MSPCPSPRSDVSDKHEREIGAKSNAYVKYWKTAENLNELEQRRAGLDAVLGLCTRLDTRGFQESQLRFRFGCKYNHDDVTADPPITVNYSSLSNPRNFYFILTNTRDGVITVSGRAFKDTVLTA